MGQSKKPKICKLRWNDDQNRPLSPKSSYLQLLRFVCQGGSGTGNTTVERRTSAAERQPSASTAVTATSIGYVERQVSTASERTSMLSSDPQKFEFSDLPCQRRISQFCFLDSDTGDTLTLLHLVTLTLKGHGRSLSSSSRFSPTLAWSSPGLHEVRTV